MNKKLTLLLNESIIQKAKGYAARQNDTLSGMVEKYFRFLVDKEPAGAGSNARISRDILDLTGMFTIPEGADPEEEYRRHRAEKSVHE